VYFSTENPYANDSKLMLVLGNYLNLTKACSRRCRLFSQLELAKVRVRFLRGVARRGWAPPPRKAHSFSNLAQVTQKRISFACGCADLIPPAGFASPLFIDSLSLFSLWHLSIIFLAGSRK